MPTIDNQYTATRILTNSSGGKRVLLAPVYTGDPDYTTGVTIAANSERQIEIYVPKNSSSIDYFEEGSNYTIVITEV